MSNTFVVVVLIVLLGGAGAYYGHSRYGSSGLRSVIGLVLVVSLLVWLFGGLHIGAA
jgi:lipopolysaccharide export LptBFGC system permease protein LptF